MARRLCLALTVGLLALSGTPRITPGDGAPPALRVLFPADQSVLETGRFELICLAADDVRKPPALRIDGKSGRWQPFALPVLVARLDLKPGRHEIAVGPTKLQVCVGGSDLPPEVADWPVSGTHPGGADGWKECHACHEVTEGNGRQSVGALDEPVACQHCHSSEDFQLAHFHPEKPLAGCHQCHALHGSSATSLLKAPRKQLCATCHD
jgi:predicted CXXCH cytochrome family protein